MDMPTGLIILILTGVVVLSFSSKTRILYERNQKKD